MYFVIVNLLIENGIERWIEDKTGEHIVLTDQHKLFGFKGSHNSALKKV